MHRRKLGRTGLSVSQVGFGAIKLPQVSQEQAAEALNTALDLGINFIDTARNYKDSEQKIGRAVGHRREEFYIATKSSARDAAGLRRDLETSLSELGMERVDLYQLHTVSSREHWRQVTSGDGALAAALQARDEGLFTHLGITVHRDLDIMRDAITCGEFETIMVCYSPIDTEGVGPDILPLAGDHDVGVIVMKALSGGMLVSEGFEEGRRPADEDPLVTAVLRYVLSNECVSCVIPGMRNAGEVRQNARVGAGFQEMDDKERADLVGAIAAKGRTYRYGQQCLQCGYCQPCPQGIDIPAVFRAQMTVKSYPEHLQRQGYDLFESLEVDPEECMECGQCAEKCPAGISVPEQLQDAAAALRTPQGR